MTKTLAWTGGVLVGLGVQAAGMRLEWLNPTPWWIAMALIAGCIFTGLLALLKEG